MLIKFLPVPDTALDTVMAARCVREFLPPRSQCHGLRWWAVVNPTHALPQMGVVKGPLLPRALKRTGQGLGDGYLSPARTLPRFFRCTCIDAHLIGFQGRQNICLLLSPEILLTVRRNISITARNERFNVQTADRSLMHISVTFH